MWNLVTTKFCAIWMQCFVILYTYIFQYHKLMHDIYIPLDEAMQSLFKVYPILYIKIFQLTNGPIYLRKTNKSLLSEGNKNSVFLSRQIIDKPKCSIDLYQKCKIHYYCNFFKPF